MCKFPEIMARTLPLTMCRTKLIYERFMPEGAVILLILTSIEKLGDLADFAM